VFWTNAFHLAATSLAAIDKERWQIAMLPCITNAKF
jgi:hypothetical protein